MKYLEPFENNPNTPRLIPNFKQPERKLLSVFLALLGMSASAREIILKNCGYNSGRSCTIQSAMEVSFKSSMVSDVRPDGLIVCTRGKTQWAAFVEAKAERNAIRSDQIHSYLDLARQTGVGTVITISNEFARTPDSPPYHLDTKKTRNTGVFHFAWADIRTSLEMLRAHGGLEAVELGLIKECLDFFWDERSGVATYDAMPEVWPAFVEAASTTLGFNANVKGLTDVVYGWQQERRDLCSKLIHFSGVEVELRHVVGVRADDAARTKVDRQMLADDYMMSAHYHFKTQKLTAEVLLDLRACRMTAQLDIPLPDNKGAKATVAWLAKVLGVQPLTDASICIDWPWRGVGSLLTVDAFLREPEYYVEGHKLPPKGVKLIISRHGVRTFKSRKKVISDVEAMVLELVGYARDNAWV